MRVKSLVSKPFGGKHYKWKHREKTCENQAKQAEIDAKTARIGVDIGDDSL